MMTLITGFTCPPTICFKFITKCDKCYYKVRQLFFITKCDSFFITKCDKCYYKVRQVLQSVTILLQSATGITKCDDYYKVRQYSGLSSQLHLLAVGFYTYIQNKITYDETKTEGCEYSKGKKHC